MTDIQTPHAQAQLTGTVLFYSRPEPLNKEQHANVALKQLERPFAFAAGANVVPLTVTEFAPAALSYPIIFVGEAKQPVAVMGVQQGENLFITADGTTDVDAYLPAYVRRYPFVLANDEQQQRMIVCIDRGAPMLVESGGDAPLFQDGEPTEYTKQAINFCTEFENERQRTDKFVELLKSLDLFDIRKAQFTPRMADGTMGEPQQVAEYFAVSEEKLAALSSEKYLELRENGALGQIYAHLISILGWEKLYAKALVRRQQEVASLTPANIN